MPWTEIGLRWRINRAEAIGTETMEGHGWTTLLQGCGGFERGIFHAIPIFMPSRRNSTAPAHTLAMAFSVPIQPEN